MAQFIQNINKDTESREQEAFDRELKAATESILGEMNQSNVRYIMKYFRITFHKNLRNMYRNLYYRTNIYIRNNLIVVRDCINLFFCSSILFDFVGLYTNIPIN